MESGGAGGGVAVWGGRFMPTWPRSAHFHTYTFLIYALKAFACQKACRPAASLPKRTADAYACD